MPLNLSSRSRRICVNRNSGYRLKATFHLTGRNPRAALFRSQSPTTARFHTAGLIETNTVTAVTRLLAFSIRSCFSVFRTSLADSNEAHGGSSSVRTNLKVHRPERSRQPNDRPSKGRRVHALHKEPSYSKQVPDIGGAPLDLSGLSRPACCIW